MTIDKWIKLNTHDLSGQTVAITGATGGIGIQVCKILSSLNANLILIDRNEDLDVALKNELLQINPNISVNFVHVDMEDFQSMQECVKQLSNFNKIDVLILNAGAYAIPRKITNIGYDNVFQINFVSPYFLVKSLLPILRKSNNPKVVLTSSIAHNYSKIDERDIDFRTRKKSNLIYGNSKRFITFSLMELFEQNKDISLSIVHPGITFTKITNHYPKFIYAIIKYPMKMIFISNKKASLNIIKGVFDKTDYMEWIGPSASNIWGYPKKKKLKTCSKEESAKIFETAENIYKNLEKL
ncbi:MAG TPA: SDR family NAD(P)-dependent oxidoreductase [Candidatus Onthoplasma faecipullorum]|nr:SDR family NAD(P)-dependent oxidoreductase [Candidatus Onthoplasma faecipullorum]